MAEETKRKGFRPAPPPPIAGSTEGRQVLHKPLKRGRNRFGHEALAREHDKATTDAPMEVVSLTERNRLAKPKLKESIETDIANDSYEHNEGQPHTSKARPTQRTADPNYINPRGIYLDKSRKRLPKPIPNLSKDAPILAPIDIYNPTPVDSFQFYKSTLYDPYVPSRSESVPEAAQSMEERLEPVPEVEHPQVPAIVIPKTGLEQLSQTQLERLLNIKWSHFIPPDRKPWPKQVAALMLADAKELFYGGAAGGGKSDWLLMEALRYCDLPGFSAIIFRKQLTDLKQSGGLIPRALNWLAPMIDKGLARYAGDEHKWYFKTTWPGTDIPGPDATLQWGYIGEASVRERYLSAEFQMIGFEELCNWEEDTDYVFMFSRLRKNKCIIHGSDENNNPIYSKGCRYCDTLSQMPLRVRAASNPGPAWIKRRFGIIPDPSQYSNRHDALVAISEGKKIRWVGTRKDRPFIAAYVEDNPALDANDYHDSLSNLSEEEQSRLKDGNWEARKDARFKRSWQKFYHLNVPPELLKSETPAYRIEEGKRIPIRYNLNECSYSFTYRDKGNNIVVGDPIPLSSLACIFVTVDTAVTTKQGPVDEQQKNKRSFAVISTFGITHNNNLLWLNMRKFRKEIPDLVEQTVEVNSLWLPSYNKVECNGVGIGVAQYLEAAGLPVRKNYKKTDKIENSLSAQMLMKAGMIWFPENAEWLEECEDVIFSWTGLPSEEDDVVDTLSDAANDISLGVAHEISAPAIARSRPRAVALNHHRTGIPTYGLRR